MSALNERQRAIRMKRLEGKHSARQSKLCLGLIKHKGMEYFDKRPLHVFAIAILGGLALTQTKRLSKPIFELRHIAMLLGTLKKE